MVSDVRFQRFLTSLPWQDSAVAQWLKTRTMQHAIVLGWVGSIVIALCSHAVGATRNRGGFLQALGLRSFTFGHLNGMLAVVLWFGIVALILSWVIVGYHLLHRGQRLRFNVVAAWLLPLLFAAPLMSRDVYSYLMQGALARDGFDAYSVGASANPGPILFEVSADWRNTTTPYGPAHLWLGEAITRVVGDTVTWGVVLFKIISLAAVLVMMWALASIAKSPFGQSYGMNPHVAVWLGVCNPASVLHLVGGMHTENMMLALILCGVLAAVTMPAVRGLLVAAACVGVATALKATAVIALPFIVWITVARTAGNTPAAGPRALPWFRESWPRLSALVVQGLLALTTTLGVLAAITVASGQTWGWVSQVTGNSKVINPLAFPSFVASTVQAILSPFETGLTFNTIVAWVRPISSIIMLAGLVIVWWVFRHNPLRALQGATAAYAITCVFNAVTLPWYYTTALAFAALWVATSHARTVWLYAIAVWCAWISMMFDGGGNNRLYVGWWVIGIVLIMGWIIAITLWGKRKEPS